MKTSAVHPCFDIEAKKKYARIHIPIAPKCNVQCNFCNRKYDCVNESRPGVTSAVLNPTQALNYMRMVTAKIPNVSTIGVAGPGDAFAQPEVVMEALSLIKNEFPDKIFCVSTNGMEVEPYLEQLKALDVTHLTITINSFREDTLAKIYSWARINRKTYQKREAAKIILENQSKALARAKELGFTIKINSIVIPGVNDTEMGEIAKRVAELGAHTMNCIPMIPAPGSKFEDLPEPTRAMMNQIKEQISVHIKPMTHCARCRADAAGMLGKDDKSVYKMINDCTAMPVPSSNNKPYVAVATNEGLLINQHLGEATHMHIYKPEGDSYTLVETRATPSKGEGDLRWIKLAKVLHDCQYALVGGVGAKPTEVLQSMGIGVVEMSGLIEDGLNAVYKGEKLKTVLKTNPFKCGSECGGNGQGCG